MMVGKSGIRRAASALIVLLAIGGVGAIAWLSYDPGPGKIDLANYEQPANVPTPRPTVGPDGRPLPDRPPSAEAVLLQQAKTGSATQKAEVGSVLKQMLQNQPTKLVVQLPQWLAPLMEAGLYAEVLDLTDQAFEIHAASAASVSDFQEARVKATLALGRTADAPVEAKRAFAVATQKVLPRVLTPVKTALAVSPTASADDLAGRLRAVDAKSDRFLALATPLAKSAKYADLMKAGSLFLLADRPTDATAAFTADAELPDTKGKNLIQALDGIVRAYRASNASAPKTNALAKAFRAADPAFADAARLATPKMIPKEVQSARSKIAVADLPD